MGPDTAPSSTRVAARGLAVAVTIGGALTVVATFAPWVRSGSRDRSSYEILDLVERLGFADGGFVEWALRVWPLVPLTIAVGVVASWWGRRWVVSAAAAGGLFAAVIGAAVASAPDSGLVGPAWGAGATAVAGLVTALAAVGDVVVRGRARPVAADRSGASD